MSRDIVWRWVYMRSVFFFQAEDGIRDYKVTGVQTCALPILLFLGIQQLEGHIVVPKVMGHTLRLHPLLVIFGLLAGGEIYGFPGILVALPLLEIGRASCRERV